MRACLDTNVLVAAFATRGLCADVLRAVIADHELVLGEVILEEPERALTLELGVLEAVLAHVKAARATAVLVSRPAASHPMALRDSADRWVVATAVAGDADGTGACRASGLLILTGGTERTPRATPPLNSDAIT